MLLLVYHLHNNLAYYLCEKTRLSAPAAQRTAIHASLLLPPGQWQPLAPLPGLFDA
jgi:hypothetical protein